MICFFKLTHCQDCKSKFQQAALQHNNEFRLRHNAGPLVLSDSLIQSAQTFSEQLAETNSFHNSGGVPGENLFMVSGIQLNDCASK